MDGIKWIGANSSSRGCGWDLFNTVQSPDLLDQIDFTLQIDPEAGDLECDRLGRKVVRVDGPWLSIDGLQTELAQVKLGFFGPQLDSEQLIDLFMTQRDAPGRHRLR